MNQKKAKELRRVAKSVAARNPRHAEKTYRDIAKRFVPPFGYASRTTILASGWRFIQQRLKRAIRRHEWWEIELEEAFR